MEQQQVNIANTLPVVCSECENETFKEVMYMRKESRAQAESVIKLLRALVEHYVANPKIMFSPGERELFDPNSAEATKLAVTYVGGMTDRFACRQGVALLNWPESQLPQGIGT